jgi:putative peptide zinc metalloprotease protein
MRRLAALAGLLLTCALAPAGAQAAPAGLHDNVATAIVQTDGAAVSDFAWDVERQRGGNVDQLNSARAAAQCTDCRATAIAFQIVLVSGHADSVTPRNEAVAINRECTRCVAVAEARQFVRVLEAPVRFTGEGRATLADVRRHLRELAGQGLAPADLDAAVEQEEARVLDVLANDVVLKSDPETEADVLRSRSLQDTDLD